MGLADLKILTGAGRFNGFTAGVGVEVVIEPKENEGLDGPASELAPVSVEGSVDVVVGGPKRFKEIFSPSLF